MDNIKIPYKAIWWIYKYRVTSRERVFIEQIKAPLQAIYY